MSQFWRDWLERVLWTLAQVVVGVLIVEVSGLDYWWVAPVAALLAMLKGLIARKVGDPESASLGGDPVG